MTMTSITNGKYHIPLQSGVPVGASRVEIVSMPDTEGIPEDQRLLQAQQDFIKIPPQYNTNSKLKAEIPPGKGPHLLDFSLTR